MNHEDLDQWADRIAPTLDDDGWKSVRAGVLPKAAAESAWNDGPLEACGALLEYVRKLAARLTRPQLWSLEEIPATISHRRFWNARTLDALHRRGLVALSVAYVKSKPLGREVLRVLEGGR